MTKEETYNLAANMPVGVYRHYKGAHYQVLGIAGDESNNLMVVYISLEGASLPGPRMRLRPLAEFLGNVDVVSQSTCSQTNTTYITTAIPRFTYVGLEIPKDR